MTWHHCTVFGMGTIVNEWSGIRWNAAVWTVIGVDGGKRWCRTTYPNGEFAYRTLDIAYLRLYDPTS